MSKVKRKKSAEGRTTPKSTSRAAVENFPKRIEIRVVRKLSTIAPDLYDVVAEVDRNDKPPFEAWMVKVEDVPFERIGVTVQGALMAAWESLQKGTTYLTPSAKK